MKYFLFTLLLPLALNGFAQQECTWISYYSGSEVFNVDSVYEKVNIDGQYFSIKVLYDKKNEYLEEVEELTDDAFSSPSPITLVISNYSDGKIVYVKKFGNELPRFYKKDGNLDEAGRLYLNWFISGGGSGYSLTTSCISLQDERIVIEEILQSDELSYMVFSRDGNEIYLLRGIWDMYFEDEDSGDSESHFSDHKYQILVGYFNPNGFHLSSVGVTKEKYSSDWENPKDLLLEISKKETLLGEIKISDFY